MRGLGGADLEGNLVFACFGLDGELLVGDVVGAETAVAASELDSWDGELLVDLCAFLVVKDDLAVIAPATDILLRWTTTIFGFGAKMVDTDFVGIPVCLWR